ncbi:MAG: hypothetical protein V2I36_06890 [Desulfopila sp.]|jgi:hypothetical protein|nr:hypothetical protein [Desulfopila sp.]
MQKEEKKTPSTMDLSNKNTAKNDVLDRDTPGPVSVSPGGDDKPSYTHNADKTDPIDPHLSGKSFSSNSSSPGNVEDDALDRDKTGPVSVSPEGKDKPSYTYNADKTDPIDPHLADMSEHSRKETKDRK